MGQGKGKASLSLEAQVTGKGRHAAWQPSPGREEERRKKK